VRGMGVVAGAVVGVSFGVLLLILIIWLVFRKKEKKKYEEEETPNEIREDAEAPKAKLVKPNSLSSLARQPPLRCFPPHSPWCTTAYPEANVHGHQLFPPSEGITDSPTGSPSLPPTTQFVLNPQNPLPHPNSTPNPPSGHGHPGGPSCPCSKQGLSDSVESKGNMACWGSQYKTPTVTLPKVATMIGKIKYTHTHTKL
ncbi:hypothetical protein cypCar_00016405, partial [Cyprinus carpio]